jgi:hypothetical protein
MNKKLIYRLIRNCNRSNRNQRLFRRPSIHCLQVMKGLLKVGLSAAISNHWRKQRILLTLVEHSAERAAPFDGRAVRQKARSALERCQPSGLDIVCFWWPKKKKNMNMVVGCRKRPLCIRYSVSPKVTGHARPLENWCRCGKIIS